MSYIIIRNTDKYPNSFYQHLLLKIKNEKQIKINKLKNEINKKESILGEYLLIYSLKKYYHLNYQNIDIYYNDNNKPLIKNHNIYYNITHSNGLVGLIISSNKCGIDIEKIKDVNLAIIKTFATINEQKYILENNSLQRLFEIYTLKEAYIKMKGLNLTNIKEIEFIIKDKQITCHISNVICTLKHINNYIVATCEEL